MTTALFIIVGLLFCCFMYVLIRWYIRYKRASKYITKTIEYWKKNPTQMELSLATTGQIVEELLSRPIPIILISPINGSHNGGGRINLNVVNLHPEMATMLLSDAAQILKNNNLYGGNQYEQDDE